MSSFVAHAVLSSELFCLSGAQYFFYFPDQNRQVFCNGLPYNDLVNNIIAMN